MTAFDYDDVPNWRGLTVIDQDGDPVGTITDIYADDLTGRPEWVTVNTGLFGSRTTFVPVAEAILHDRRVQVPFARAFIKDAPSVDVDGALSAEEEAGLFRHYGLGDGLGDGTAATTGAVGASSQFTATASEGVDAESPAGTAGTGRLRLRRYGV